MQYHGSKGAREQSGAYDLYAEREDAGFSGFAPILTYPTKNEDQIHVFYPAVTECLPSQVENLHNLLATGAFGLLEVGLQQALPAPPWQLLQGS